MLYLTTSEIDALEADPDQAAPWFVDRDPTDLGRAWHGLHVLLNGSAWGGRQPLLDAVLGGTPLGDPTSYEPVRYVAPGEVAAVAAALPAAQELKGRFTHQAMRLAEAYPDDAWTDPGAWTDFLAPAYDRLVAVFSGAAARGEAVLITLDRT
jgi:hypothetical protein